MSHSTWRIVVLGLTLWFGAAAQGAPLAVGVEHGVLLKPDGSVWTWGSNHYGQLGTDDGAAWSPVRVPGLGRMVDVAAGDHFTLAVKNDGTVWAWGENERGELGNGGTQSSPKPAQIAGLTGVVAVAAAGQHALALKSDGTVWAWGDEPDRSPSLLPKQTPDLTGAVAIAAADKHSVALKSDGTVWVWGDHGAGDLGNGNYNYALVPIPLRGLSEVTAVAAGHELTVALKKEGTVWTTGYGAAGQLGNGSTENSAKPVMVNGLAGVKALAAGDKHVLALEKDGTVWSWGNNHESQLGNTRIMADHSAKPVRSGTLSGAVAIAAASHHSVAVTGDGTLWAWGQNDGGVLGADPEGLDRSDLPMKIGQEIPGPCSPLFVCGTAGGKVIRICGEQDDNDSEKWSSIQYRFGPENGPPELVFPKKPAKGQPPLYFSHEMRKSDYFVAVRFSTGAYTYRVFSGSKSGAGVEVEDAKGKTLSTIECGERPKIFPESLRLSLPCDPENPHGAAACKRDPYAGKN
ncbi:MAG: hypothetical protein PHE55_10960 [Methylococcaceae bacterium]|nr:hypothetical protein [Methylococcaceae bacterium]